MAEFKISRFRYTWKGNWTTGATYIKDDVVEYGGCSYVCLRGHTAAANFYTDIEYVIPGTDPEVASPAWVLMTKGEAWRGDWLPNTQYNLGDVIQYGGGTYLCTEGHTSALTFDIDHYRTWETIAASGDWRGVYASGTRYTDGDIVRYGGTVYKCINEYSSTSNRIEPYIANWEIYYSNVDVFNTWTALTSYKINDLVKYGGSIWRCTTAHTGDVAFVASNWEIELYGYHFGGEWESLTLYHIGDIVRYGGDLFYSQINNNDTNPRDSEDSTIAWVKLATDYNLRGVWAADEIYHPGDLVRRGGNLYVALTDVSNDGSSLDYLSETDWELVIPGWNWRKHWTADTSYALNDLVIYKGTTYKCTYPHTSTAETFPGDNGSVYGLWDPFAPAGDYAGLVEHGDLVTYNLSRSASGDGSTMGPTPISIGTPSEVLKIDNEISASFTYEKFGTLVLARYVSDSTGEDREDFGDNPFTPYKTIRYACEQIDKLNSPNYFKVFVNTGVYEEVLPIIVPARTAIMGTEVRSVTVKANAPITNLSLDVNYTSDVLTFISSIADNIIRAIPLSNVRNLTHTQDLTVVGASTAVNQISQLITDIKNYISYYIESGDTLPTLTGTNTINSNHQDSADALENNKEFLAAEAVAYMQAIYPDYSFDSEKCARDVRAYVDAWKYDILYTGNYKSLLAARYYKNAVLGSELEDMFYVRDATGIRNMTLKGLTGTLNPPGVYEFYQRPTGGAYVSLDPGWGPDDDRTWISTRSPYIQNCATFGYAAVGQKIDGALHNGGNKSMVSNDFTQIIDEGIGAWVTNGGRAELVSIFTYYSQVGYLTENGGIIRSTNGNNSYGRIGAMALGVDSTETPLIVSVNTKNNVASIISTFTGPFTDTADSILAVEYANAGRDYSTASWSVSGAGVNASVIQEEFRDQAVYEALLVNPYDSTGPGGSGFTFVTGNAQTGTSSTIKLAGTDSGVEAEYLGLRIIIVSGTGAGQYGYISAYNPTTKYAQIKRESDDQAGWDHIIPGYPILSGLLPDTRYQIEPRVMFTAPDYNAYDITMPVNSTWSKVIWGETYASFTDVEGSIGTGEVVSQDGLVPITASFDIVKNGRYYSVSINNVGAGYADEQTIIINGSDVGGIDGDNDIIIRVTAVSEDSTNSIVSFVYDGQASSGNFVAFGTGTDDFAYSPDGITWTAGKMPSSGNWTVASSGGGKFIAAQTGTNIAAYSEDGITWTAVTLPATRNWTAAAYGNGTFVIIASNLNGAVYSTNGGQTWSLTSMPTFGDSSFNTWVDVTYGRNVFYAISNTGNTGAYSTDGITWYGALVDATEDSSQPDWVSITYGNGRFLVLSSQGNTGYSFDGNTWYQANSGMPKEDGSTTMHWNRVEYGQGVFVAVCDTAGQIIGADATTGPTTFIATSEDGILWTGRALASSKTWVDVAFGNPNVSLGDSTVLNNVGTWIAVGSDTTTVAARMYTGAKTKGRILTTSGIAGSIRLWDPGSGYTIEPTMTVVDPNNTTEAYSYNRLGSGVLGQPTWLNRGTGYKTASTRTILASGDGYADVIPSGKYVTLSGFSEIPGPGAQLIFENNPAVRYRLVTVQSVGDLGDGSISVYCQVSPTIEVDDLYEHGTQVSIRTRYSQNRITGHDFLDVGTGNFLATNYPELYSQATFYSSPENEIIEGDGGRVFYTSTDQNGNFRTGELFAVEQATGIVTISADFFDLQGLSELRLGGVRLGGSSVVIREFSTDPLFTEDSNNIVPTQRAITTYLASRLSVAGSDLIANAFTAGEVNVGEGGTNITNILNHYINIPVVANFSGASAGVNGMMWAMAMFYRSFRDDE